jgi:hypothetical protein
MVYDANKPFSGMPINSRRNFLQMVEMAGAACLSP